MTTETMDLLPEEALDEWEAAFDEFETMSEREQEAWIDIVRSSYPMMDELPDPAATAT